MKTLSLYAVLLFSIFNTQFSFAQKSQTLSNANIKVWGNCESCKKRIETAAKKAGASTAAWDEETKNLVVNFDGAKTSTDKIEQAIAAKGHDTQNFSADAATYDKLPGCCKYDRKQAATDGAMDMKKCCTDKKCTGDNMEACKEMKCCTDMSCCKDKKSCDKHGHDGTMKCGEKEKSCCKKAKA